jgi:hypothetical protein
MALPRPRRIAGAEQPHISLPASALPMAWTLFEVPQSRRTELDELLKDDQISRQSHKLRDAAAFGRPSGALLVLIEGAAEAVARAEQQLQTVGTALP